MIRNPFLSVFFQLIFHIICLSNILAQQDTLYIPKDYNIYSDPHIIARGGSVILNQSDSLHLISNFNFKLLGELLRDVELMDTLFQSLKTLHARDNQINQEMIDKLNLLLDESLMLNKISNEISNERINQIVPSLNDTQKSLDIVKSQLDSANEHLENARKVKNRKALNFAAGGAAFGLIIGLIIGN